MTLRNPIIWKTDHFCELPNSDQLQVETGTAAAPSIVSRSSANTGIYYTASSVRISVGGTLVATFSSTGISSSAAVDATTLFSIGGTTVINSNRLFLLRNYTVASLPAGVDGATAFVTDANETWANVGTAPTGGGTNKLPVYYDSGWKIG